MDFDRNGFEVLSRQECLRLLRSSGVGRIGLTSGALPVILPVNYACIDDDVVVRTSRGTKLSAAADSAVVAFEVDQIDPPDRRSWSVMVTGVAEQVTDPDQISRYDGLELPAWAGAEHVCYVRISTDMVSGRRVSERSVPG